MLLEPTSGTEWLPPSESTIGRSPLCTRQLDAPDISKEHASIRWTAGRWEIRDLNSRNGTFAGGTRLGPGDAVEIVAGMTLRFGSSAVFEVTDDAPPDPMAQAAADGRWCIGPGGLLPLPSDEAPEATVHRDGQGRWLLEHDGEVALVQHGDTTVVAGETWRLFLPSADEQTLDLGDAQLTLASARLRFVVSRDEEHIQLFAQTRTTKVDLKARAHHYVLLTLARARRDDATNGVEPAEQGWVYHGELARMLSTERTHINVAVYRLRKQLHDAGFSDAARCIERRLTTGQLRIGVPSFEIESSE